ncbi:MAG: hypothetical protein JOZ69_06485 [Myxococcales bacterium]|nr:hypothetical protein [Myxococcales bacterium]
MSTEQVLDAGSDADPGLVTSTASNANYVREHSANSILRSTLALFRQHFPVLVGATALPILPMIAVTALHADFLWLCVAYLFAALGTVPVTCVVSDACLGRRPSLVSALKRTVHSLGVRALFASLATAVLVGLGLLLVVPGLLFAAWWSFAAVIVILERQPYLVALKRSRHLGRGHYLRNGGMILLVGFAMELLIVLVGGAVAAVLLVLDAPKWATLMVTPLLALPLAALPSITLVLLYYDMRSRKEAYDTEKLAEDFYR